MQFIVNFDSSSAEQRANMSPTEFDIEIPAIIVNSINIDEVMEQLQLTTLKQ